MVRGASARQSRACRPHARILATTTAPARPAAHGSCRQDMRGPAAVCGAAQSPILSEEREHRSRSSRARAIDALNVRRSGARQKRGCFSDASTREQFGFRHSRHQRPRQNREHRSALLQLRRQGGLVERLMQVKRPAKEAMDAASARCRQGRRGQRRQHVGLRRQPAFREAIDSRPREARRGCAPPARCHRMSCRK
jgi:hypothetical protein